MTTDTAPKTLDSAEASELVETVANLVSNVRFYHATDEEITKNIVETVLSALWDMDEIDLTGRELLNAFEREHLPAPEDET